MSRLPLLLILATLCVSAYAQCAGTCLDSSEWTCSGGFQAGKCTGASNIMCCPTANTQCHCVDTNMYSCSGAAFVSGKCPGAASIKCCPAPGVPVCLGTCMNNETSMCPGGTLGVNNVGCTAPNKCCPVGITVQPKCQGTCVRTGEFTCQGATFDANYKECPQGTSDVKCCPNPGKPVGICTGSCADSTVDECHASDWTMPTFSAAADQYNRRAAVRYAAQWWNNANHDCSKTYDTCTPYPYYGQDFCGYPSAGGDCATFVSQTLVESGHPGLYQVNSTYCRGFCSGKIEPGAKNLGDCLAIGFGWTRQCGLNLAPPVQLQIGDVIIFHQASCADFEAHAVVVTSFVDGVPQVTCHSPSLHDVPYTQFLTTKPYVEYLMHFSTPTTLCGQSYSNKCCSSPAVVQPIEDDPCDGSCFDNTVNQCVGASPRFCGSCSSNGEFSNLKCCPKSGRVLPLLNSQTRLLTVWPYPSQSAYGTSALSVDPAVFEIDYTFSVPNPNPAAVAYVERAIDRYYKLLFPKYQPTVMYRPHIFDDKAAQRGNFFIPTDMEPMKGVQVTIQADDLTLNLDTDESYTMFIAGDEDNTEGEIESQITVKNVYGLIRALETLSQLIDWTHNLGSNAPGYYVQRAPIQVVDAPRFKWRGLEIDSARHFLPVHTIKRMLDAMAFNKLNVLHWHLSDAESFPIDIPSFPLFHQKSTYSVDASYSYDDLRDIVAYAKDRAIRVVPEIDTPGHTASFGQAYPELIADCWVYYYSLTSAIKWPTWNNLALDVTNPQTKVVFLKIFQDLAAIFDFPFFHIGTDEVITACWQNAANVIAGFQARGLSVTNATQVTQVWSEWEQWVQSQMNALGKRTIGWEELITKSLLGLRSDTIVNVYNDPCQMELAALKGYASIMSAGWYLDKQQPTAFAKGSCMSAATSPVINLQVRTWMAMYTHDPASWFSPAGKGLVSQYVLGGEASSWGESADPSMIDDRIFTRIPAVAERLWSPMMFNDTTDAQRRMDWFHCHVSTRGIRNGDSEPTWCAMWPVTDPVPCDASVKCNGNGYCSEDGTECICTPGWTGDACDIKVCDPATSCSAHGSCQEDASCLCATGFTGAKCDACAPNFFNYPACTPAPNCGAHGVVNSAGLCACTVGWTGAACDQCAENYYGETCTYCLAADSCSAHGECVADGSCVCATGFAGAKCDVCAIGYFGFPICSEAPDCGAHGVVNNVGACVCTPGWTGDYCDGCADNFFGPACTYCVAAETCSAHGTCQADATCLCATGFAGAKCDVCAPNFFNYPACTPAPNCGAHGVVNSAGLCACAPGWTGAACDQCAGNYYGEACTYCDAATCSNHGTCADDASCVCATGFAGLKCEACAAGFFNYPACTPAPNCGAHGVLNSAGVCVCAVGWTGAVCDQCSANYFGASCKYCDAASTCSGHGSCDSNGLCVCATGFAGASCDVCAVNYYGATCQFCDAASTCSGHGVCNTASGACVCAPEWTGANCAVQQCVASITCSGHGTCNGLKCQCATGWTGPHCDTCAFSYYGPTCAFCDAASTCSGHGTCDTVNGGCLCSAGWMGAACDQCAPGYQQVPNWNANSCKPCHVGQFSALPNSQSCTNCPAGTAQPLEGQTSCNLCAAGQVAKSDGQSQCSTCPTGSFSASAGASTCSQCPKGQYQALAGQTACATCAAGTYNSWTGAANCNSCWGGSYSAAPGSTACTSCPMGTAQGTNGATACTTCPAGKYTGSVGELSCDVCWAGSFSLAGASSCTQCAKGYSQSQTGASTCNACQPGQYNNDMGDSACWNCNSGSYSDVPAAQSCTLCPKGSYQQSAGQTACSLCPMGKYSDYLGAQQCQSCWAGMYNANQGASTCTKCAAGSYSTASGVTTCTLCPANSYQANIGQAFCLPCFWGYCSAAGSTACTRC